MKEHIDHLDEMINREDEIEHLQTTYNYLKNQLAEADEND